MDGKVGRYGKIKNERSEKGIWHGERTTCCCNDILVVLYWIVVNFNLYRCSAIFFMFRQRENGNYENADENMERKESVEEM